MDRKFKQIQEKIPRVRLVTGPLEGLRTSAIDKAGDMDKIERKMPTERVVVVPS